MYNVSKETERKAEEYKRKGYKIRQTTDSYFLTRKPNGKNNMKRIGVKIGTGGGSHASTTVFAYKDVKK